MAGYYIRTPEHNKKMSIICTGIKKPPCSDVTKKKLSIALSKRILTEGHKQNIRKSHIGMELQQDDRCQKNP